MTARRLVPVLVIGHAIAAMADSSVAVHVEPCVGDEDTIRGLVDLELDPRGSQAAIVHVKCVDDGFTIEVDDRWTGKRLERRLRDDRDEHPHARERVVALAIVELVRASWLELVVRPAPVTVERPAIAHRVWTLGTSAQVRSIGAFTSVGGGATFERELGRFRLGGDIALEHADRTSEFGDVDAEAATGSLRVGCALRGQAIRFGLGGGIRAGVVSLVGNPRRELAGQLRGLRVVAPWLAPVATVEVRSGDRLGFGVVGEAGVSLTSARGFIPMEPAMDWGGGFVAARATVDLTW
jgi:hypothetical protein